ncbi:MAG: hypothetical protein GY953_42910 [bacterium]|nr:hypothetical protein [bacterium]
MELVQKHRNVIDYAVQLVLSETNLAACHFDANSAAGDQLAADLYKKAEARLAELLDSGRLAGRAAKYQSWLTKTRDNLQKVKDRMVQRQSD